VTGGAVVAVDWPAPPGVRACYTTRRGGASVAPYDSFNLGSHVGDVNASVADNRERLLRLAALPAPPVWLEQVHGAEVVDLDREAAGGGTARRLVGDAAVTRRAGRACVVLTADCLPVLLADIDGSVVAAVHAGWRGLAAGVVARTVTCMGVAPQRLVAWCGPRICASAYEVGDEVRQAFAQWAGPPAAPAFERNRRGRWQADLSLLASLQLQALGIRRIHRSSACTFHDQRDFFSHRRDGACGRTASLIWLQPV
jgi:YfiH family protein